MTPRDEQEDDDDRPAPKLMTYERAAEMLGLTVLDVLRLLRDGVLQHGGVTAGSVAALKRKQREAAIRRRLGA